MEGPDEEGAAYPVLEFWMKLNDVKGGQVTASIYVDTGSGFYHPSTESSSGTVAYDPSVTTGDEWNDQIECPIVPPAGGGIAGKAKIVFDYIYPDGETGQIETAALPVHSGTYVKTNEAYSSDGYVSGSYTDPETNQKIYTMSREVILDSALVIPSAVTHDDFWSLCLNEPPWTDYPNPTCELYTDGNGNSIMRFTYTSDTPFPEGNYWFAPVFYYPEDAHNGWSNDYYVEFYYHPS